MVAWSFKNITYSGTERATEAQHSLQNLENLETQKVGDHSWAATVHPAPKRIPSDLSHQLAPREASQRGSQDSHFSEQQEEQPFSVEMPADGRRQLLCAHTLLPRRTHAFPPHRLSVGCPEQASFTTLQHDLHSFFPL